MNLTPECVDCLFGQSLRVGRTLGLDDAATKRILDETARMVPTWGFDETPPRVASRLYPRIAGLLGLGDIYADYKAAATRQAAALIPAARLAIETSDDPLTAALKAAVAGNVIDLAASRLYDLEEEIAKVFAAPFAQDDTKELREALASARRLMIVGDNAGEHLFDKLLMQTLRRLYPDLTIAYAVRGVPIINDVTYKEAEEAGIGEVADIVDSGVDTPGLDLARASEDFVKRYEDADVVIAKGMGNYECLEADPRRPVWYLLKVKCKVVAASLKAREGDLICRKGAHDV